MGNEHDIRKWFGEIVVGTRIQCLGFVEFAVLGGKHQNRCPVRLLAQPRTDLEAVYLRQHDVEHDRVVLVLRCQPQPMLAVEGVVDGETFGFQAASQRRGQSLVVLDHQDPHHHTVTDRT